MTFDATTPMDIHAAHKRANPVKRANCANGLYIAPAANAQVDSSKPMLISWDNTCFSPAPAQIDIYLSSPFTAKSQIYTWYSVDYKSGQYSVDLKPKWWNSTAQVNMQLNIIQAGQPSFLTTFPVGPMFVANYDAASAATNTAAAAAANTAIVDDSPYTTVNNTYHAPGLAKGPLAAAVLLPLLAVFAAVGAYVVISRRKEKVKRQRYSQAFDKRMSVLSGDWKSMSGAAANHAIRQSMAISGDRGTKGSSFFAGSGPRPSSTFTQNEAGVGARYNGVGLAGHLSSNSGEIDMSQIRRPAGTVTSNPTGRVSTISFAADAHPRPSMGDSSTRGTSIYTRTSRAFHRGTVYDDEVPPVPDLQMSPTQTEGPSTLTPGEIRAKIAANADAGRPSIDDALLRMPAMTMMRTSDASNDMVLSPVTPVNYPVLPPTAPAPAPAPVPSTFSGMAPLHQATPAAMTPDAMLKAYAAGKKASVRLAGKKSGAETTQSANGGMRTLYAPPTTPSSSAAATLHHHEDSSAYDEDAYSYYGGTNAGHGGHTESEYYGTEEGVVTYGQRATVYGLGDEQLEQQRTNNSNSNNPFLKSGKPVSAVFSEGSRYSGMEGEAR